MSSSELTTNLNGIDIGVVVAYFVFVLLIGIWSSVKSKRDTIGGYFLADRSMNWFLIGASLFASNISSSSFIGLAGSGAGSGIAVAGFELNALFVLLLLGWIFLPVYLASGVFTMPEYLKKRFGGERIRVTLSVLSLILYIFIGLSANLYSGALFIRLSFGFDLYLSVVCLLLVSAIFTISGGQTAVIWTDFFQIVLTTVGAIALAILSFIEVGGYEKLFQDYRVKQPNSSYVSYDLNNQSCSRIPHNFDHLFRPVTDSEYPWTGMTIGVTISSIWCWCSDQVIVQRALSAKNMTHGRAACVFAGYLKILPLFLMVMPGMIARVLYPDEVGCSKPEICEKICGSRSGCTNIAFPLLVIRLMPEGARGLMMAVMMAALMSSLAAVFNSSATIFTLDIWTRLRKRASEMELLIIGRIFVVLMVAVAIVWIPIIQNSANSKLIDYIQSVTSYLSPPVCAIFVLAILTERANEKGAFWGLTLGLVIGIIRFCLEFIYTAPTCGSGHPDNRPLIISKVNYLHFGCILFFIVVVTAMTISWLTKPIDKQHLHRLTFWTRYSKELRIFIDANTKDPIPTHRKEGENSANPSFIIAVTEEKIPLWKRFCFFVCGISQNLQKTSNKEAPVLSTEEELHNALNILDEKPFWRNVTHFNGVLLLVVAICVWAYYG